MEAAARAATTRRERRIGEILLLLFKELRANGFGNAKK
jgi:hypothetical protein